MPIGETGLLDSHRNILPSRVWATPEENIRMMKEKKTSGWTRSIAIGLTEGMLLLPVEVMVASEKQFADLEETLRNTQSWYYSELISKSPRVGPDAR